MKNLNIAIEKAVSLKKELDTYRPIDAALELKIMQKFRLDWNYHSNHLEGNSLTYGETKALLLFGITAQGKPLKDHLEIEGHEMAIKWVLDVVQEGRALTENFIRELHQLILKEAYQVDAITPTGEPTKKWVQVGQYKSSPNHVKTVTGEIFRFAEPEETPAMMQDLLNWYRTALATDDANPILIASEFHYRFIRIHPFDDGNGRCARILMNFILLSFGYPPVVIKTEDKAQYFAALRQADAGILTPFTTYITENLVYSLELMIRGAKGDKIEEDTDLDKELALFKQSNDTVVQSTTKINIPESTQKRIVIIGGGFAGLAAARKLAKANYQVVLIDKNNYHQFQPLFYQVAMAGLEPSSIAFPFRKLFRRGDNVYIRVTEVTQIDTANNRIVTPLGHCNYDHLIVAIGADTNYYGNAEIEANTLSMKSVGEALYLRNTILSDYETALTVTDFEERQGYIDIVIVGGGPTGVELAGALAEMKKYVLPKDYPELNCDEMDIYLIQSSPQLLKGMSEEASEMSLTYLKDLGVNVRLNTQVKGYDGEFAYLSDGEKIRSRKVIWAAGIKGCSLPGLPAEAITYGNRLAVDRFSRVQGTQNVYAIGDIAYMEEEAFPKGHPQVAQVALQQGQNLAKNLTADLQQKEWQAFNYQDKGSMATVGRNRAVVDLKRFSFHGFMAWAVWLLVHLFAILGTKNKLFVFLNWVWNYLSYDQSLRLIIRAKGKR